MLWYKAWSETRWRFLIGLAVVICSAASSVFLWPKVSELLPLASSLHFSGEIGRRIQESVDLARQYRGYVWSNWFRQSMAELGTVFAVLLGTGGFLSQPSGGALFTLSMPASRSRLLRVRAMAGLAELLVLVLVPSLIIPLMSPAVGEAYGVGDALVHGGCAFIALAVFFSLATLLSTVFNDLWRPLLVVLAAAVALNLCEQFFQDLSRYGIFHLMSAEVYFRTGRLPWAGLLTSAAASAAMLYGAAIHLGRRDF